MEITIVMPCSRPDFLQRIFSQLDMMDADRAHTHILTYVDGDQRLFEKVQNFTSHSNFVRKNYVYRAKGIPNVGSIRARRQRIADIHNEVKKYIGASDYLLLLEDDTLPPLNILKKLVSHMLLNPYAGFITAAELGRWGFLHLGAWKVNDVYTPTHIESPYLETGLQEIDAAGLYCCLMRRDLYMNHYFKPFEDILGPDVDLGIELRKQGYKNYIDYDLRCSHLTKKGEIKIFNSEIVKVVLEKHDGEWTQETMSNQAITQVVE